MSALSSPSSRERGQRILDLQQLWLGYVPQMEEGARPSPKQMAEPGLTSHGLETGPSRGKLRGSPAVSPSPCLTDGDWGWGRGGLHQAWAQGWAKLSGALLCWTSLLSVLLQTPADFWTNLDKPGERSSWLLTRALPKDVTDWGIHSVMLPVMDVDSDFSPQW